MSVRLPERASSAALLVGASRFADERLHDLPAVANNLKALAATLTDPVTGVIEADRCRVLPDPRSPSEVGAALDEVVEASGDTMLVYYAGHGLLTPPLGTLHLAVADSRPGPSAAWSAVPSEWVRGALANSPAKNRILVLDCCYSGRATSTMSTTESAVTAAVEISGTYTITSAPKNEASIAEVGAEFTVFTGELLRVLRAGIAGAGNLLSLRDIYTELLGHLAIRGMPRPQQLGSGLADLIALARNAVDAPQSRTEPGESMKRVRSESVAPADLGTLGREFHQALVRGYQRAKREINYNASIYIAMIAEYGAVEAVRRLVHSSTVSTGFTTLWEKGRLDLTVEAFILQERWRPLFTDIERDIARRRLSEYGYDA